MTSLIASINPENGANTKKVMQVSCSTPDCTMPVERGDKCIHCRLSPRGTITKESNYTTIAVLGAVLVIMGAVGVGLWLMGR